MQNINDGLYESDNSVNDTNVDDEEQVDERKPAATVKKLFTNRVETLEYKEQIDIRQPDVNATKKLFTNIGETIEHKEEDVPSHNRVVMTASGLKSPLFQRRKRAMQDQKQVKKEEVAPRMFRVDVPIPYRMKLDHFWPNGTPCFVIDPITPGPKVP